MQRLTNKTFWATAIASILWCLPFAAFAQTADEEPAIVLRSSIYDTYGEGNSFSVLIGGIEEGYIDVDCGFGTVEYELKRADYSSSSDSWSGTLITCNVSKEGIVKIYGDASNIDVLNASGCYLREAQLDKLSNLAILNLSHNELEALDLTDFTKLQSLDVSDNPFNKKPLIVGGNKPELYILDIGRVEHLDQSFNLSDFPSLISFDAWASYDLRKVDPSGCPNLQKLSIDGTPVSTLDVSKNPVLQILNISDTGIQQIDISNNPNLVQLYLDHTSGTVNTGVKLETIDISKNTNLMYLYASGNNFKEIDLSNNRYLQYLYLNNNKLTSINLDNNPNLVNVELRNNFFTFATLPLPQDTWSAYYYSQRPMEVARSQKVGTVIDLSEKVLREGTMTTAMLYSTNESNPGVITPLSSEYYTYDDGKITLLKAVSDSVYVAFANDAFPESEFSFYPLCTNKFMVKSAEDYGQDDKVITFMAPMQSSDGTPVSFGLGIGGASPQNPKKFYVDYGDGKVEHTATSEEAPATPNATGHKATGTVTIYVPENELVTAFDMEGVTLNSIDLTKAPSLRTLRLVDAGLYSAIDLSWNKCLASLELTGNHFYSLNIRGLNDAYQKNLLHDINLSNNELREVTLNDNYTIHNLNLSDNQLTELSFKDADNMLTLDVSGNKLTAIDVNYCTMMTSLNIANNAIASVTLPAETSLTTLHCENNALTFATLPAIDGLETYTYAPQNEVIIAKIGPGVDLSEQNIEAASTEYVWKKADGTVLAKGTDYTEEGGITRFLDQIVGTSVYCEMTNPAFAGLTLRTSAIEAAGMPQYVIATFTTTNDQTATLTLRAEEPSTPIYIDWKGNQIDLEEYLVGTSPTSFTVQSHKDATVRVYSYNEVSNINTFSISGISMGSLDASKLNQLVCLNVGNAGMSSIKLPESDELFELYLEGSNLGDIDLTRYPKLAHLSLAKNPISTFDATRYPLLEQLSLSGCGLNDVKLGNSKLWNLILDTNNLTDVDLSGVPNVEQMSLYGNQLSHIDVSPLSKLRVLFLDQNRFKFSTLPLNNGYALYTYANQAVLDAPVIDGSVDLSSEAVINGTETVYRWFVDVPSYDDYGELTGEELYIDDEYLLNDGVTTFTKPINNVMCVLTNEEFPNMVLTTPLIDVTSTGIGHTTVGGNEVSVSVSGHSVSVKAASGTTVRLIGADGRIAATAATNGGQCTLNAPAAGAYVVMAGNTAFKILVK